MTLVDNFVCNEACLKFYPVLDWEPMEFFSAGGNAREFRRRLTTRQSEIILNFNFKEFRFGLHADYIVLVDFLHLLRSIKGRFIYAPNQFDITMTYRNKVLFSSADHTMCAM